MCKKLSLKKLLTEITPENTHLPVDWGRPFGNEMW